MQIDFKNYNQILQELDMLKQKLGLTSQNCSLKTSLQLLT